MILHVMITLALIFRVFVLHLLFDFIVRETKKVDRFVSLLGDEDTEVGERLRNLSEVTQQV